MSRNKNKWVQASDLPEKVQMMLERFEAVSGKHGSGYTVIHYRDDAVFVQVYGMCNLYVLARLLVNSPDIYCELEAAAPRYWTLRMFASEWATGNGVRSRLPTVSQLIPEHKITSGIWVRRAR